MSQLVPSPEAPLVSLVLAVGNGWDTTFETLVALARSTAGLRCETVVVDDGSTDETSQALPHLEGLRLLRNQRPVGLDAARDQGAGLASGTWLAFFEAGGIPGPGWLQPLLSAAAANPAGPAIPVAAGSSVPGLLGGALFRAESFRAAGGFSGARGSAAGPSAGRAAGAAVAAPAPRSLPARAPGTPPLVSVVVPLGGGACWVDEALQSVRAQTYPHWELLLVRAAGAEEAPASPADPDPRLRQLSAARPGPVAARNRGLEAAAGDLIAFLDPEDRWAPNKLERQVAQLLARPEALLAHTSYARIDAAGLQLDVVPAGRLAGRLFPSLLLECPIATSTVMLRRSLVEEGLRFPEDAPAAAQTLLWAAVAQRSEVLGLDEPLSEVRRHAATLGPEGIPGPEEIDELVRLGLAAGPALGAAERGRLASTLYGQLARVHLDAGDLPRFTAAALMAWLAPVAPTGSPEAAGAALANLLAASDLRGLLASADRPAAGGPSALEVLQQVLTPPSERACGVQVKAELASRRPLPPEVEALRAPPLITVLVPSYNQAGFLPDTLDSLLAQTYPHWEAVVVDDGSTDGTREVMARYAARDPRFRTFHKANGGVATALNEGIRQARGEWICWLSSDDLYRADKLALQVKAIQASPGVRFHHTSYHLLDERRRAVVAPTPDPRSLVPEPALQVVQLLAENYVNGITVALHRSVFEAVGRFDDDLRQGQDYDLWLRLSARFPSAYLEESTCLFRVHPAQGSNLFRAANVLDSGRAGLKFLNAHRFEALFPLLDLARPEEAARAMTAAVRVAANTNAYLTISGFAPALVARLQEWVVTRCPASHRAAATRHHDQLCAAVQGSALPPWVKAPFRPLPPRPGAGSGYVPLDPLVELRRHREVLRSSGQVALAHDLSRYLHRVSGAQAAR